MDASVSWRTSSILHPQGNRALGIEGRSGMARTEHRTATYKSGIIRGIGHFEKSRPRCRRIGSPGGHDS